MVIILLNKVRKKLPGFLLALFVLSGCNQQPPLEWQPASIVWKNDQAIGFIIPVDNISNDFNQDSLNVYLSDVKEPTPILGDISFTDSSVLFRPLVPLTNGLTYRITYYQSEIENIRIPVKSREEPPALLAIYPTADTLPENLLKFYFKFSKSMSYAPSFQNVCMVVDGDTIQPFLPLQNELWNRDRTVLTLWLDPGRIKRELTPNREQGNPLEKGKKYELIVKENWRDAGGITLPHLYVKYFFAGDRDNESPAPENWTLNIPKTESREPLTIQFNELLDFSLANECFRILDDRERLVAGTFSIADDARTLQFNPDRLWQSGSYRLQVNTILEDLAGNNLNRLFDQEISKTKVSHTSDKYHYRNFEVE